MTKYVQAYALSIFVFSATCKGQTKTELPKESRTETKETVTSRGPNAITRTISQDRNGNIWLAAFDGVFRYDGKLFTHVTHAISSARFFSVLEDRQGNMWFGSIGSGVYRYDGKSFQNFATEDGLPNNEIVSIYEDKAGNIWFGANGGVSRYDGQSFRNYMMIGDSLREDRSGMKFPDFTRPPKEINAIIEDKTGRFWFVTRNNSFVYDGETFTIVMHDGKPFTNVRWVTEDKRGNIWLGGSDGLWRYSGNTFTNITPDFVGYIYEDRKGNLWTSSQSVSNQQWVLTRYDEKSLSTKPTATDVKSIAKGNGGMIFGIMEAYDGTIWFGGLDGAYRYDGHTITSFKTRAASE